MNLEQKFRVFVRLRPVQHFPRIEGEEDGPASARGENGVCTVEHRIITLNDPAKGHSSEFVFDRVFGANTSQEAVFNEMAKPLIQHVLQGYNGCCFAYGQTGSGKTYSMFGKENSIDPSTRGIIPLSVVELFKVVESAKASTGSVRYSVYVSLLEIYLEQVRDLGRGVQASLDFGRSQWASSTSGSLSARSMQRTSQSGVPPKGARQGPIQHSDDWTTTSLDVMEDPSGTTIVKDMTYIEVTEPQEVMAIVQEASQLRATAATLLNDVSSRSHTVFTLSVVQQRDTRRPVTGRLHLVDLAGSERWSKSGSEGARLSETKAINKSLSSLGKVVMALTQGLGGDKKGEGDKHTHHVPYRDSKLTRILKNSLQGNCMTHMLAALNPASIHAEECFNTLQFAVRCQNLDLAPRINMPNADGSAPGVLGGGLLSSGTRGGSHNGDGNEVADQLAQQVAALQEELELTHAHYQKMIEGIAGPNWTKNLGPLERAAVEAAERRSSLIGESGTQADGDLDQPAPLGGAHGWQSGGAQASEQAMRRMEAALDAAHTKQREAELALQRRKLDADEFRDRFAAKDHMQLAEIRKLRAQVADLTALTQEIKVEEQGKVEKVRLLLSEEVNRLCNDNEVMRSQLEQVTSSVGSMMKRHSEHVNTEQQSREALRAGVERSMKQQIEAVEKERLRQVDNLKQQSSFFLEQKSQEIFNLKSQITQMKTQHDLEAKQLRAEVEHLAAYAERLTEVLQKMEAGVYGMVEMAGVRALKLPPRDRPAGLDQDRLLHLRSCGDAAQRLVELVRAAAAGPRPGSRPSSSRVSTTTAYGASPSRAGGTTMPRSAPPSAHPGVRGQVGIQTPQLSALPVPKHASLPLPLHGLSNLSSASSTLPAQQQLRHHQGQQQQPDEGGAERQGEGGSHDGDGALATARAGGLENHSSERSKQYIHSLEAALDNQRAEAAAERRKQIELTVALRSAQRAAARSPNNPLHAALLNAPTGALPTWGYGHQQLSTTISGGLASRGSSGLALSRPCTAGPMRSSSVGAGGVLEVGAGVHGP